MTDPIPGALSAVNEALAHRLHLPDNFGVVVRPFAIGTVPAADGLVVFMQGMADQALVRTLVIEPLTRLAAESGHGQALTLDQLAASFPAPGLRVAADLQEAIHGVVQGNTVVFLEGARRAVLVETIGPDASAAGAAANPFPDKDLFSTDLGTNVSLMRKRFKTPDLVVRPIAWGSNLRAVLLYLDGAAAPALVDGVRQMISSLAGEETFGRGLLAGKQTRIGGLPKLLETQWPDKAALLLDSGYVAVLADRISYAYIAPVTAEAMLLQPFDSMLTRPLSVILPYVRVGAGALVLTGAPVVVALMNYHQEMMPTAFLLALASSREQEALPILGAMLFLEFMQEVIREIAYHLPFRVSPGTALIAGEITLLLVALSGAIGLLPASASVVIAFVGFGLLSQELIFAMRFWRFAFLLGAAFFGFFGISAVWFVLTAYLHQASSFGYPFICESGVVLTGLNMIKSASGGGAQRAYRSPSG